MTDAHGGLSRAATTTALTISKQNVLRGVSAGERGLAAAGWSLPDLLPR